MLAVIGKPLLGLVYNKLSLHDPDIYSMRKVTILFCTDLNIFFSPRQILF